MLKDAGGQLTLQAQTESGIVDLLVCDYRGGEVRGYVRFDAERLAEARPAFAAGPVRQGLSGDHLRPGDASGERYQGIVPLGRRIRWPTPRRISSASPSRYRAWSGSPSTTPGMSPAASLLQHLPEGEEGRDRLHTRLDHPEWDHVRILAETIKCGRTGRYRPLARDVDLAAVS